jgi:hypothetical protein
LGEYFSARLQSTADQIIDDAFLDGMRNFTFEQYCELLNQAFSNIESTGESVDETRKVCVLLQGTTDSRLSSAKTQILDTPLLKDTFEHAVNLLNQFFDEKQSIGRGKKQGGTPRNVSASTTTTTPQNQDCIQKNPKGGYKGYNGKNKTWQKKGAQSNHTKAKSNVTDRY